MHLKFLFLSNLFSYYKHVLFLFWLFHIQLEILKNVSIILLLFLLAFSHFFSFFFLSFLFLLLFSFALFFFHGSRKRKLLQVKQRNMVLCWINQLQCPLGGTFSFKLFQLLSFIAWCQQRCNALVGFNEIQLQAYCYCLAIQGIWCR